MEKLSENVYVEVSYPGCNTSFVVTEEGVVVIDTPMVPAQARQWVAEAEKHGPIVYVINNEPHPDHIAGDYLFPGKLIAHEDARPAMMEVRREQVEGGIKHMAPDAPPLDEDFHFRLPDITFSERMTIHLGKHTIRLFHTPGHTASETVVYVPEEKVIFTSDNVTQGMPIMFQSVPYGWLDSLKRYQEMDVDKVVPGHGEVCDKAYLQVMYDNVKYCIDSVQAAIDKGWSLKEIQEKVTFADRFPPMGPGDPMAMMRHEGIARIYEEIKK